MPAVVVAGSALEFYNGSDLVFVDAHCFTIELPNLIEPGVSIVYWRVHCLNLPSDIERQDGRRSACC